MTSHYQKRHYIELAALLKEADDLKDFERELIHLFHCDNERFSESRFRAAADKTPTP